MYTKKLEMQTIVSKIAFAVIILCLLTLMLGITKPDLPINTIQAAPTAEDGRTPPVSYSSR
jgi:hypothetical protein